MSATPTTDLEPASTSLPAVKKSSKAAKAKPSKTVILKLSSAQLQKFPSDQPSGKASRAKPLITIATPLADAKTDDSPPQDKDKDNSGDDTKATDAATSEVNGDSSLAPPTVNNLKRKGGPGSKSDPAKTASAGTDADATPKPRNKPGPKRRKVEGEAGTKGLWTAPPPQHQKLGPKANQGDINARLRALDRRGAPCRKWERKGLQLSSFNGIKWDLSTWKKPPAPDTGFEGDVKSETSSSEAKQEPVSSNVASEKSQTVDDSNVPPASTTDLTSSPTAPPAAVPALTATS